jgi:hypothetical protein
MGLVNYCLVPILMFSYCGYFWDDLNVPECYSGGQQATHSATGASMPETSLSMHSLVTSLNRKP